MGKHETSYRRVRRDLYPTPAWPIDVLDAHIPSGPLKGASVWEPAAGSGSMVRALRARGARVFASDVVKRNGCRLDAVLDFVSDPPPARYRFDLICTNPPFGQGGRLALAFIEAGLERLDRYSTLALLLPCDFDSGVTRTHVFGDCRHFQGKIVLRKRIVWFERADGIREAPKENSAWFLWYRRPNKGPRSLPPTILYGP